MAKMTLVNLNMLYMRAKDVIERELHVPQGSLYLCAALERAGHEVDFRDYQLADFPDPFDASSILKFMENPAPIMGVSCMANLLPFALWALKQFRQKYPDVTIIMGGVGPTAVETEILHEFDWIDIIVRGEAETSAPMLLSALDNGLPLDYVPGISFRRGKEIVSTAAAARITDLDEIGLPAYERVDLKRYIGYGMITTRGCPFPCTFCSVSPIWGHRPILRSVDSIINEMALLHDRHGVDIFLFQDEYFISTPARAKEFCRKLRATGMKVNWKCFGRVNLTTRDMMEEMSRAGCVELRFGIESGSENVLQRTRKGFTPEQAIEVVSDAISLIPGVDVFYIWGFPFETIQDLEKSIFQMINFRMMGGRVLPSLLCLLPQTQIYRDYIDSGKLEFCTFLFPEYMVTGHEYRKSAQCEIMEKHEGIFEFIKRYPRIFPGFFHLDLANNILPKLELMERFGFYSAGDNEFETESCGAHSPKLTTSPGVIP